MEKEEGSRAEEHLYLSGLRVKFLSTFVLIAGIGAIGCFAFGIYSYTTGTRNGWILGLLIVSVLFATGFKKARDYRRKAAEQFIANAREAQARGLKLNKMTQELLREVSNFAKN